MQNIGYSSTASAVTKISPFLFVLCIYISFFYVFVLIYAPKCWRFTIVQYFLKKTLISPINNVVQFIYIVSLFIHLLGHKCICVHKCIVNIFTLCCLNYMKYVCCFSFCLLVCLHVDHDITIALLYLCMPLYIYICICFCGTRKTATWKIVTWVIPTQQFPPRIIPTRKIPTQDNSHLENSHPDNSHLDNSHPENSHPGKFPPGKFPPRKISTQLIVFPDNCKSPNLTKFNNI